MKIRREIWVERRDIRREGRMNGNATRCDAKIEEGIRRRINKDTGRNYDSENRKKEKNKQMDDAKKR